MFHPRQTPVHGQLFFLFHIIFDNSRVSLEKRVPWSCAWSWNVRIFFLNNYLTLNSNNSVFINFTASLFISETIVVTFPQFWLNFTMKASALVYLDGVFWVRLLEYGDRIRLWFGYCKSTHQYGFRFIERNNFFQMVHFSRSCRKSVFLTKKKL